MIKFEKDKNPQDFDKLAKTIATKLLDKNVCLKESYDNWQTLLGFTISHLNWFEKQKNNGSNKILWDEKMVMRGTIETFSDFPVTTEDKCTKCGKPFTFFDQNNITCYKPWISGGFWHIDCNKIRGNNE